VPNKGTWFARRSPGQAADCMVKSFASVNSLFIFISSTSCHLRGVTCRNVITILA